MSYHRIYRYTSIGRPLDPAWPSNKAVLFLAPIALLLGFTWSLMMGQDWQSALSNGGVFALAIFGTWALGRELLPDDHAAAFVSMAVALLACMNYYSPGLWVLFTTLGLVRIVNRSTGLKARLRDSVVVFLMVVMTVYATGSPWFGAVAALAFGLDASLKEPQRRQLLFTILCLATMVVYIVDHDTDWLAFQAPGALIQWIAIATTLLFGLNLPLLKKVHSKGDVGDKRLDPERVKAGMAIAMLAALQGLGQMVDVILLVATITGLCLGIAFRRSFRTSGKGLRRS
jgi:hypothetical protein